MSISKTRGKSTWRARTHAHRAGREEDVRLSFWQPSGGTCAPPPMRRLAAGRRGGGGEKRLRGEGLGLFGVGSVLLRGGDARGKNAVGMEESLMNGHLPRLYFRSHWRRRSQQAKPTAPSSHLSIGQPGLSDSYHDEPRFTISWLECVGASQCTVAQAKFLECGTDM